METYELALLGLWSTIGIMYLILAIINYTRYRKIQDFAGVGISKNGKMIVRPSEGEEIDGEDAIDLAAFFRHIFITDVWGFVFATFAAILTGITLFCS